MFDCFPRDDKAEERQAPALEPRKVHRRFTQWERTIDKRDAACATEETIAATAVTVRVAVVERELRRAAQVDATEKPDAALGVDKVAIANRHGSCSHAGRQGQRLEQQQQQQQIYRT